MNPVAPDDDGLDRYLREVEQGLGVDLERLDESDVEAFFSHVIVCFDQGEGAYRCAQRWLAIRSR